MNRWDIFVMTFFYLDAYWDDHQTEELGNICSSMNPFLFEGEGSAVPYVYTEFCDFLDGRKIKLENSFDLANKYINSLKQPYITEAFSWISKEEWLESCKEFLATK